MDTEPTWQEMYRLAVLETDWLKMEDRVRAAEAAIEKRLQVLNLDHGGTHAENQAMLATLQKLNGLRGELARWRESKQVGSRTPAVSE